MRILNRVDRSSNGEAVEGRLHVHYRFNDCWLVISHAHKEISRQNERFMRAARPMHRYWFSQPVYYKPRYSVRLTLFALRINKTRDRYIYYLDTWLLLTKRRVCRSNGATSHDLRMRHLPVKPPEESLNCKRKNEGTKSFLQRLSEEEPEEPLVSTVNFNDFFLFKMKENVLYWLLCVFIVKGTPIILLLL